MKIILFLLGIVEMFLIRQYMKKDYPLDKKTEYIFYIVSALLVLLFSYRYSLNIMTVLYLSVLTILLNISFIDYKHEIIPNKLVLPIFIIAVINVLINVTLYKSLLFGGLFAFVFCFIIYKLSGMGGGDVKLLISLSLLIGFNNAFLLFLISFLLGSIYGVAKVIRKKATFKSVVPFGPFISIAFTVLCFV